MPPSGKLHITAGGYTKLPNISISRLRQFRRSAKGTKPYTRLLDDPLGQGAKHRRVPAHFSPFRARLFRIGCGIEPSTMPSPVQYSILEREYFSRRSRFLTRNRARTSPIVQGAWVCRHSERPKGAESGDAPRSEPDAGERRDRKIRPSPSMPGTKN